MNTENDGGPRKLPLHEGDEPRSTAERGAAVSASNEPRTLAPAPAPAPAPASPTKTAGFSVKPRRLLLEFGLLGLVLLGLGALAVWGGGALAAWLTPWVPTSVDRRLGELALVSLGGRECEDPSAKSYVENVAQPLLDAAGQQPFAIQFRVVDDPSVNAFALPGGFVTVNYGLLAAAKDGGEVAGVLAHEVQHALLRHGTRRILREMGGSVALSLMLGGSELKSYAAAASRLTSLTYDRGEERAADEAGVELLVKANIDPAGLARFFERLAKDAVSAPELLSTHPDPGDRASKVSGKRPPSSPRTLPLPSSARCHKP